MQINIISESNRRIPRKSIIKLIEMIEEDEEPPDSTVNLVFIRDRRMAVLNRDFRGKKGATDVLSFNIDDEPGEDAVFGEIYISTDTAARNADDDGVSFRDEIQHLCCHGFLHLLGYDHMKKRDAELMQATEKYYLGRMSR
ncbi:MAG: rRNA maturation RNase YbeY [candidate division Zixibacteria bacterium HGW-Zixibacteria-1]|nr:MAG: rRNA maturation RNase YbeY [candidate division Zixibacteria bacterium HGW-Zixibacteria-1]